MDLISMALAKASLLLNFLRHVIPIPLPGFTIVSRSAFAKAPARQETAEMSPYPFRHTVPVPFPRLSTIGREGLAPYRAVFVPRIPAIHYDYVFSLEGVFGKKVAHVIFK